VVDRRAQSRRRRHHASDQPDTNWQPSGGIDVRTAVGVIHSCTAVGIIHNCGTACGVSYVDTRQSSDSREL